jgi:hypothetical protein
MVTASDRPPTILVHLFSPLLFYSLLFPSLSPPLSISGARNRSLLTRDGESEREGGRDGGRESRFSSKSPRRTYLISLSLSHSLNI